MTTVEEKLKRKHELYAIFIIVLIGLLPVTWYDKDCFLIGGDTFVPVFPIEIAKLYIYSWTDQVYLGIPWSYLPAYFPFYLFYVIGAKAGLSILLLQKIYNVSLFMLPGISMYYLVRTILPQKSPMIILTVGLFYMLSPILLISPTPSIITNLGYGLLPILLTLSIKFVQSKNFKYIAVVGIISFLTSILGGNTGTFVACYGSIFLWLSLWCLVVLFQKDLNKVKTIITCAFCLAIIIMAVNLYYIIPILILNSSSSNFISADVSIDRLKWASSASSFLNIFRFLGCWAWKQKVLDSWYYPYHKTYDTTLFIFLSYFVFLISFFALLVKEKKEDLKEYNVFKYISFVFLMMFVFLTMGVRDLYGEIYIFLFKYIPGFVIFREPFNKFTIPMMTSLGICMAFSLVVLNNKLSKCRYCFKVFNIFLVLVIILLGYPFFTGEVIPDKRGRLPGMKVEIPTYYYDAANYLNSVKNSGRILLLPENGVYLHMFWKPGGYHGVDPAPFSIVRPTIDAGYAYVGAKDSSAIRLQLFKNICDLNLAKKYFKILNVDYVLYRKDVDETEYGTRKNNNIAKIIAFMTGNNIIVADKKFDKLEVYKINHKNYIPKIYIQGT